jgi:putative transposase
VGLPTVWDVTRKTYPSDLTDAQWAKVERHIPPAKAGGRPATLSKREILNAICYLVRAGCDWRMVPHDLPAWQTVYWYFRFWMEEGTFERVHTALHVDLRVLAGREPEPSVAILDSQTVKTTEKGGSPATTPARK